MFSVWSAFLGGALLSGFATPHYGVRVLLLPLVALLALALFLSDHRGNPAGIAS